MIASSLHAFAEPMNYLTALEVERQTEAQIREIARKMNVDPEFLLNAGQRRGFDFKGLFDWVQKSLGIRSEASVAASNAQPESVRESIAKVKERYALVAADTTLAKVAQLVELANAPAASRGKKKGQIKAEMQSVLRLIDKDFGFTGREQSVGGLLHYRSRHYDSMTGRFLQQDSVRGEPFTPPSLHRYVYVHNNPVVYTDPTGQAIPLILLALALAWAVATIGLLFVWGMAELLGEEGAADDAFQALEWTGFVTLAILLVWAIVEIGILVWARLSIFLKTKLALDGPNPSGSVGGIRIKGWGVIQLHRPHEGPHDFWHIQISKKGMKKKDQIRIGLKFLDKWLTKYFG